LVLLGLELIVINDGTFSSDDYLGATAVGLMPWDVLLCMAHAQKRYAQR
jgi:hypothetical protein